MSTESALCFAGLLNVILPTPPSTATSSISVPESCFIRSPHWPAARAHELEVGWVEARPAGRARIGQLAKPLHAAVVDDAGVDEQGGSGRGLPHIRLDPLTWTPACPSASLGPRLIRRPFKRRQSNNQG